MRETGEAAMSDEIGTAFEDAFNVNPGASRILLLKIPDDTYFDTILGALSSPISRGFSGVYVSFQRPYRNLVSRFDEEDVDLSRLRFLDLTEGAVEQQRPKDTSRCSFLAPDAPVDTITRTIYRQLKAVDADRKFVFIDSLSTITLHRPLSETLQLMEFLQKRLEHLDLKNVILVFSIAEGQFKEDFLHDIAMDEDNITVVSI